MLVLNSDHSPPAVIAETKKLIVSTCCIMMGALAVVTIATIFIIPFYVQLIGTHSTHSLAATSIAIEDKWPPYW